MIDARYTDDDLGGPHSGPRWLEKHSAQESCALWWSDDEAPMLGVMRHCLAELRNAGTAVDALILLQPTSPFRRPHHVRDAVKKFRASAAAPLVSIVPVPHRFVPEGQMREENGRLVPYFG